MISPASISPSHPSPCMFDDFPGSIKSLSRSLSLEDAYFDVGEALAIAAECCRVCTDQLSTKSSTTDWTSQSKNSLHITKSRPDDKHLRPANMDIRDKYFMHVRGGFSQDPLMQFMQRSCRARGGGGSRQPFRPPPRSSDELGS